MSAKIEAKWNPKDWEIKSKSIERQLVPLVNHVTTLVNSKNILKKRSGKSKKGSVLVSVVEKTIQNFTEKGTQIAQENPDVSEEMTKVIEEIQTSGK